jgi:hypothetical protein
VRRFIELKAEALGWAWDPTTTLEQLVEEMVATNMEEVAKEAILRREGFEVVGSMENPPMISPVPKL